MKATFNIPDDLYREVKARSASEGKTVKDVVVTLFRNWLGKPDSESQKTNFNWQSYEPPLKHLVPADFDDHRLESMRESIVKNFDEDL